LTEYYIETRYPPEVKSYGRDKAEEAVKLASEVEDLVMRLRKEAKTSGRSENWNAKIIRSGSAAGRAAAGVKTG